MAPFLENMREISREIMAMGIQVNIFLLKKKGNTIRL